MKWILLNLHFKIFSKSNSICHLLESFPRRSFILYFPFSFAWPVENIDFSLRPCHPLPPSRFFFLVVIERRIVAEKRMLGHIQCTLFTIFLREKNIFFSSFLLIHIYAALHAAYRYICMYLYCRKFLLTFDGIYIL